MQIDLDEGRAYFSLVGAVILNAITLPADKYYNNVERNKKIKLSIDFLTRGKLMQMWCDLAGYDNEEEIRKILLLKLK